MYYDIRHSENRDFEESYWGTIKDPDGKERNRINERDMYLDDIKEELSYLNKLPSGKILDVGCGLGFLLSGLDEKFEKFGVEVSALACETAQNYGNIFNGTLEDAKFESNQFDIIVMYHVIEHIEKPEEIIKEIYRILKPNGVLVIATPNFKCFCAKRFKNNFRLLHDKTHISLFSDKSLSQFLKDFGFRIEKKSYPYFQTRHFTIKNILRLFDTTKMSPPFYGNVMTFYCRKNDV